MAKNSAPPWRPLLILIVVFIGGSLTHYALSGTKEETTILVIATVFIAIANIVLVFVTLVDVAQTRKSVELTVKSLEYSCQANERAERVFVAQNIPRIGTTPKAIGPNPIGPGTVTLFSIVNYSGFTAYNIGVDLRYGKERDWICEWIKAKADDMQKSKGDGQKDSEVKLYPSAPSTLIERLDAGTTQERELKLQEEHRGMSGVLNLEEDVCSQGKKGLTVYVRTTWQNLRYKGHTFDQIQKYKLYCTRTSNGRSFTFIPHGIVSQGGYAS